MSLSRRWDISEQEPQEGRSQPQFLVSQMWGKGKLVKDKQDNNVFSSDQYRRKRDSMMSKGKKIQIHFLSKQPRKNRKDKEEYL